MQALRKAQWQYDNRLPPQVSETAEEAAQRAWVDNAIETLLDRQDATFQRHFLKRGVTYKQFAEAVDQHLSELLIGTAGLSAHALGDLFLTARSGVSSDCKNAAANILGDEKLREIARELLEPFAAEGVLADAEDV